MASLLSDGKPAAQGTKELPEKESQGNRQADYIPAIDQHIGEPLRDLSEQVRSLIHQINAEAETNHDAHNRRHKEQLSLQKSVRAFSVFASLLTIILAGLTLWVLRQTLIVYKGQATITATEAAILKEQQAPQITVEIKPFNYGRRMPVATVILLRNTGHSAVQKILLRAYARRYQVPTPGMTLREMDDTDRTIAKKQAVETMERVERKMFEAEKQIATDPNASEEARETAELSIELSDLEKQEESINAEFETWQQPDVPFDEQAPVLPPESTYERLAQVSEKIRRIQARQWEKFQRDVKNAGVPPQRHSPYETPIPQGLRSFTIGELAPGGPPVPTSSRTRG